jgi:hypothetical protein
MFDQKRWGEGGGMKISLNKENKTIDVYEIGILADGGFHPSGGRLWGNDLRNDACNKSDVRKPERKRTQTGR